MRLIKNKKQIKTLKRLIVLKCHKLAELDYIVFRRYSDGEMPSTSLNTLEK